MPDVRSTAGWTLPAHVAMFTGQLARSVGLGQAPGGTPQGAAPVVRTQQDWLLAQVLRRAGYATSGITTNVWAGPRCGFGTGFERFEDLNSSRHNALGGGLLHRLKWDWEGLRARADDGAAQTERVMEDWVKEPDGRPFFWFVNLVECHGPYLPPRPYHGASALTRLGAADEARRYLTFDAILKSWLGVITVPAGALARMRRLYAASLRYVDAWLGRLLDRMKGAGVLDETLVIVCSDHGENFGDDGLMTHGMSLDDRLLRVPFIVAGPGSDQFVGMRSLAEMPSRIAQAVDLEQHPWDDGLIDGLSVAQWDPWRLSDERLEAIAKQWKLGSGQLKQLVQPLTCAVSDRFKLVRAGEDEVLYDLEVDPHERSPLRDEGAMAARAGEELAHLQAVVRRPDVAQTAETSLAPDDVSPDEVADIERRMRLMGYM